MGWSAWCPGTRSLNSCGVVCDIVPAHVSSASEIESSCFFMAMNLCVGQMSTRRKGVSIRYLPHLAKGNTVDVGNDPKRIRRGG